VSSVGSHLPSWVTASAPYRAARQAWHARPRRLTEAERRGRRYDALTVEVMRRVLRPDSNCLDVGASTGALLQSMCELAPQGRHIAFEPRPDAAEQLRSQFPAVTVHAVALAAETGQASFTLVVSNPAYSGLKPRRYDRPEQLQTITVPVHRLDELVPADLPVAFIKIDVEGGEVGVLQGGVETLRRCRPIIAFEHGGGWTTEQYGTHSGMLYELLQDAGLQISLLDDWLNHRPSLTPEDFVRSMHVEHEYFFLAHPAG
jgi:FkbM family methyltransferase